MIFLWSLYLSVQNGPAIAPQHDILDLIKGSSLVVQLVLYLLVFFSIISWGIIFFKLKQVHNAKQQSVKFIEMFWERRNLSTIHDASQDLKVSPVAQVFRAGYEEIVRVSRTKKESPGSEGFSTELSGIDNVVRAMKRATSMEITKLEKSLTFLATTASTAPFVGLFGTVWGIIDAFSGLGAAGSASLRAVAPGISEALVTTAAGLFTAIPAVIFYNSFLGDIRDLAQRLDTFALEVTAQIEKTFL